MLFAFCLLCSCLRTRSPVWSHRRFRWHATVPLSSLTKGRSSQSNDRSRCPTLRTRSPSPTSRISVFYCCQCQPSCTIRYSFLASLISTSAPLRTLLLMSAVARIEGTCITCLLDNHIPKGETIGSRIPSK